MSRGTRFWRAIRDASFALVGISALALATYFTLADRAEKPIRLKITAGRSAGERFRIAEVLKQAASTRSITLELVDTAGSDEAAKEVDSGRLDLALAQGALDLSDHPNLRQVATLHVEPLHLLVKEEIHPEVTARLTALRGKRIGLGEPGSGTHRLSVEVLAFVGLRPGSDSAPGDFVSNEWSYTQLLTEPDRAKLPDAVFMVSTLPSPIARHLVLKHRFRLVALPFFEGFTLGTIDQDSHPLAGPTGINRRNLHPASIPAFAYEVEPGVPPSSTPTLGTRLLLLAHKNVSPQTIARMIDVVYLSPFGQAMQPVLDPKLLDIPPEIPWHPGTLAYLRRNSPVIAGDVVDLIEKELSIIGAVVGGLFFFVQWLRRRYRRRRDQGFEAYILRVNIIEKRAIVLERARTLDLVALLHLQEELSTMKGEALEKFVDGELDGEEMMSSFLTHVADTRDFLTRLILHARSSQDEVQRLGEVADAPGSIIA